mmetsp:Transcript_35312/g.57629  ORF Transcript_35312/g.57629 Transcript_35312/m.57629 type:complete len:89 (+) Transcript_35312:63-329(+)
MCHLQTRAVGDRLMEQSTKIALRLSFQAMEGCALVAKNGIPRCCCVQNGSGGVSVHAASHVLSAKQKKNCHADKSSHQVASSAPEFYS